MACTYDFDFLLCGPSLPAPDIHVDKSAFDDLPVEERLSITQRELEQMKKALRLKESEMEDSQQELKFHAIKNEELMDVINAFRSTSSDRAHEIMRAKAEQNSELTLQVHTLRDLLTKSGDQIATLQKDLAIKANEGEKLASIDRTHKRLQVQLKGLVKTLDKVEINNVDIPSEWINLQWITGGFNKKHDSDESDKTIQDITQKIITMEADRQRLLKESKLYNQGDGEKEKTILSLERKLRKMKHDKDELKDTNKSLQQQLEVREGKIGALEELFQNINHSRKREVEKESPNRSESLLILDDDEDDCESIDINSTAEGITEETQAVSFEDMFTNIWTSFTGSSSNNKKAEEKSKEDEDQEISSCMGDSYHTKQVDEELRNAETADLDELRKSNKTLSEDYEAAQFKISDLSSKLEESTIKANSYKTKAGLRERLLKDVIQQYKELQMENEESKEQMVQLKQKMSVLLQLEKERHAERKTKEAADAANATEAGKIIPTVEESPTFVMSDHTRTTVGDDGTVDPAASEHDGIDKTFLVEDHKRLEDECDRLQHEFDSAIEKLNDMHESLNESKEEIKKCESLQADQARIIALLESEKAALEEKIMEESTQPVNNESLDEVKEIELRYKEAHQKQKERERDLWDVIEQYKKIADENIAAKDEKDEIEHELMLTQKVQIQRRDLVYEYRKLEKGKWDIAYCLNKKLSIAGNKQELMYCIMLAMEEAVQTGEELSKELQAAKSEAAVNKEEARGIRKRLAGCHFHYKELQQHYDEILKQNEEYEKQLAKAEKYEALHNEQADSWADMMDSVREKRRIAEEKANKLLKENEQLQQLCDQLQADMGLAPPAEA